MRKATGKKQPLRRSKQILHDGIRRKTSKRLQGIAKNYCTTGDCTRNKPCYNPARLVAGGENCQAKTITPARRGPTPVKPALRRATTVMPARSNNDYLKIGDVARRVGISPTVIRMWESLGLARPRRTASGYRMYSQEDVRLLKRASFLRKVRGMNAPAIVQTLKRDGHVHTPENGQPEATGALLRRLRLKKGASLATVAEAAGISVGFLSALE